MGIGQRPILLMKTALRQAALRAQRSKCFLMLYTLLYIFIYMNGPSIYVILIFFSSPLPSSPTLLPPSDP